MVLIAMWGDPVDVKGLCLNSIGELDGFCLVWGEGVPTDVEFDERRLPEKGASVGFAYAL